MMHSKLKPGLLIAVLSAVVLFACSKYKDPPPAGHYPELDTIFYCNDPIAVNYNWGFPGTPDSTKCIYAVDSFEGNWIFKDTILLPNNDIVEIVDRNLTFTSTEDSIKTHLAVTGWCSGNVPFYLTANKYGRANVDSLPAGVPGQLLCVSTDTLNGYFNKRLYGPDTMKIELTITNAAGTRYHKGIAFKQ
jgi:hypothetical protein